jgi:hypothetical protein
MSQYSTIIILCAAACVLLYMYHKHIRNEVDQLKQYCDSLHYKVNTIGTVLHNNLHAPENNIETIQEHIDDIPVIDEQDLQEEYLQNEHIKKSKHKKLQDRQKDTPDFRGSKFNMHDEINTENNNVVNTKSVSLTNHTDMASYKSESDAIKDYDTIESYKSERKKKKKFINTDEAAGNSNFAESDDVEMVINKKTLNSSSVKAVNKNKKNIKKNNDDKLLKQLKNVLNKDVELDVRKNKTTTKQKKTKKEIITDED